jgi:methyl-accepting chemotaxis protein
MELENDYNNDLLFKKKDSYKNKLEELKGGINLLLEEFVKLYILAKLHPNNDDIQEKYQSLINNINELQSKLFSTSNNIQTDINNINKTLLELNGSIQKEKQTNKHLKKQLGMVESTGISAEEMINDYKEMYNEHYLRNWALLLSTLFCFYTIYSVYKTPKI